MSETTIDHDTIRKWVESKGGKPAAVDRTHQGGDVGIIRIMFPNNPQSEHGSLVEISWDEFFEQFEESQLALLYDEKSLFSKIVGRDTAEKRSHGDHAASRHAGRDDGKHGGGSGQRTGAQKGRGDADQKGAAHKPEGSAKSASAPKSDGPAKSASPAKSAGTAKSGAQTGGSDEERSLKEREYRDAEGNIHHHTRTFEEQHGRKGQGR